MPVRIRKLPGKKQYRVYDGKKIVAKCTTHKKAEAQEHLLNAVSHGWEPTGKRKK